MRILNIVFVSAAIAAAVSCAKEAMVDAPVSSLPEETEPAYLPGEVVLKFDESLGDLLDKAGLADAPATRSGISTVDQILELIDGYQLERVFPVVEKTEEQSRAAGLHLWYVVRFGEDQDVEDVVKKLSALGEVQAATPVRTIKKAYDGKVIPFNPSAKTKADGYSDEDLLKWQWNLVNNGASDYRLNPDVLPETIDGYPFDKEATAKFVTGDDIGWSEARKLCQGAPSIIVAVLDEGIDLVHPDLVNSLWVNEDEVEYSTKDNDGNGYAGDRHGYNFISNSGEITWDSYGDSGHGTHCAGIIAAENGNAGISSIAGPDSGKPDTGVRIMSCQVFSGNLSSNTVALARAIKYATDNGAVVLQCSFGYTSGAANPYEYGTGYRDEEEWEYYSPLEKSALDYFIHNAGSDNGPVKGGIPVFAAGNEYAPMAGFPGAYTGCVSVASVAADFTPATYTNYGPGTVVSAPGGDQDYYFDFQETDGERGAAGCILSTVPVHVSSSGYGYMEGTSMACPHVSGVVALGLSYAASNYRHFTASEFIEMLKESCTPIPDNVLTGKKFYYKWQVEAAPLIHARTINLPSYRNGMGAGVVNVAGLLDMIQEGGVMIQFPNLYINEGASVTVNPAAYIDNSSFTVTIDNPEVAAVKAGTSESAGASVSNVSGNLTFTGLKSGSTSATINGQTFAITVRTSDSWL